MCVCAYACGCLRPGVGVGVCAHPGILASSAAEKKIEVPGIQGPECQDSSVRVWCGQSVVWWCGVVW